VSEYERRCELAEKVGAANYALNAAIEAYARTGLRVVVSTNTAPGEGIEGQEFVATICAVPVPKETP
jgi:hypothetical protein